MIEQNKPLDIDKGIEEYRNSKDSILVDVRTKEEFDELHFIDAINIPLQEIDDVLDILKDKNQKIFLYCRSGNRSGKAETYMKENGYKDVKNIGGIMYSSGKYTTK